MREEASVNTRLVPTLNDGTHPLTGTVGRRYRHMNLGHACVSAVDNPVKFSVAEVRVREGDAREGKGRGVGAPLYSEPEPRNRAGTKRTAGCAWCGAPLSNVTDGSYQA